MTSKKLCGRLNEAAEVECQLLKNHDGCHQSGNFTWEDDIYQVVADYRAEIKDQPEPIKNDLPSIQDLVIADIEERKRIGIERYGTLLQAHNGRDAQVDAYQEILDLVIYSRQVIEEGRLSINEVVELFHRAGFSLPQSSYSHLDLSIALRDIQHQLSNICGKMAERNTLLRERAGEVWFWQGNEFDNPESITCPILIQPHQIVKMWRRWIEPDRPSGLTPQFIEEFRTMGLALHTNHSNAGSALRLKEWSTCSYHFCKARYDLAYPKEESELPKLASIIPEPILIPIPMILHCPECGFQHIDESENEEEFKIRVGKWLEGKSSQEEETPTRWTNPTHKSHLCANCGTIWRPASVPTTGVASIDFRGEKDTWPPKVSNA